MNSIAQHARPKLMTHSEYRRPQLRMNFTGWIFGERGPLGDQAHLSTPLRHA